MKNILKKIIAVLLITITIFSNHAMILKVIAADVNAGNLTINLSTDKDVYTATNENIYVKASWDRDVNRAGFNLNYNSSKVEFLACSIEDEYINTDENGVIKIDYNKELRREIDFVFVVKGRGSAEFSIDSQRNFELIEEGTTLSYTCSNNATKSVSIEAAEVTVQSFNSLNDYIEYRNLSDKLEELNNSKMQWKQRQSTINNTINLARENCTKKIVELNIDPQN